MATSEGESGAQVPSPAYESSTRLTFDNGSVLEGAEALEFIAAAQPAVSAPRETGRTAGVVRVRHDEGWGVVDTDATPGGCWAHFSVLELPGYRALLAGQEVELDWEAGRQDGYRYRATHVRKLEA